MKRSSRAATAPGSSTPAASKRHETHPRSAPSLKQRHSSRSPDLIVYIDGASRGNPGPAGVGVYVTTRDGAVEEELFRYIGETTNNVAEYEALLHALRRALELTPQSVTIYSDSELLVRQMCGKYRVKNSRLAELHACAQELFSFFPSIRLEHVGREKNGRADALANRAIDAAHSRARGASPVTVPAREDRP